VPIVTNLCNLEAIRGYVHEGVVARLQQKYGIEAGPAGLLLTDTVSWLWLSRRLELDQEAGQTGLPERWVMYEPLMLMDLAWHELILYSRDYQSFCQRYLGCFIHHQPTAAESGHTFTELSLAMSYAWRYLGEETVRRWLSSAYANEYLRIIEVNPCLRLA
jgi:hypothetical protein